MNRPAVGFAVIALVASCARTPLEIDEVRGGTLATMRSAESIRSLHDPTLIDAAAAERLMRPGQKVVGFEVGGRSIAIALRVLDDHEIVNLSLAQDPESAYAVTW